MRRWFDSFVRAFGPAPIILLLVTAAVSLADDAADLKRIIHAYADSPGDTLMLHARIAPGIVFDPEPLTWHPNIAFDTLHISNAGEANANAVPPFHNLKLCEANRSCIARPCIIDVHGNAALCSYMHTLHQSPVTIIAFVALARRRLQQQEGIRKQ